MTRKRNAQNDHQNQLRQKGVAKKDRPKAPTPDHCRYPTMQALAIDMVRNFVKNFPEITIKGVLADALYGTGEFMGQISQITGGAQVVSQIRSNQIVSNRNSQARVDAVFARQRGVESILMVRGAKERRVTILSARLFVKAQKARVARWLSGRASEDGSVGGNHQGSD